MFRELLKVAADQFVREYDALAEIDAWKVGHAHGSSGRPCDTSQSDISRLMSATPEAIERCYVAGYNAAQQGEPLLAGLFRYFRVHA